MSDPLKMAYADPPYVGCCALYDHYHPDNLCWNDLDTTFRLIDTLNQCYDAWALSCKSDLPELVIEQDKKARSTKGDQR